MSEVTTNTGEVEGDVPRAKKADYRWLNARGEEVEDIEVATGVSYEPVAGGRAVWQIPGAVLGSVQTMLALAGAKIELRNAGRGEAEVGEGGGPANRRIAACVAGDWGARSGGGGGGGRGYDLDKLADAIADVMTRKKKNFNREKVRAALENGGMIGGHALEAKAYRAALVAMVGVREAYDRLMGRQTKVEDIADDLG